jgi:hypothetical protein
LAIRGVSHMNEEFRNTAPNTVESKCGFTVQWIPVGGILYRDSRGEWRIDSEILVKPPRILVYEQSRGLQSLDSNRRDELLSNVRRALEHMGHSVEFWNEGRPTNRK